MLPCLLFLVIGMVGGETCDVVFQDSTHAKASVQECITSMMQDFVSEFESARKSDIKLIKSMQIEIENLKADNLLNRKEIDQLKYAYQKQERQYQQLSTESSERVDIIDRLKIKLDNITLENGYMKDNLDSLSKAYLQKDKKFERSVLTPRTHREPITDVPGDLSPSNHAPARSVFSSSGDSEITPVAFHAILAHQVIDPGNDHELSFEHVITNTGNYYSHNTGAFTAYQPGSYVFTWEITASTSQFIDTHLLRNGDVVGSIRTWGYSGSGSTSSGTAVLALDSRDEVLVRVGDHTSGADVLPTYTMFSGFRLC
ncbi:Complement C1q tumor necrosis factor-related protein 3 [Mizuhopecten yessoensis]|uniref:Complement C1q tumor necrosis factor-related protein 3 n=1 Tax=Mizuhopecten yessoensis TaxID=6573 RepID=A0A210QQH6_MIZYE|nr:Complement C1q tumor necrosis factor-related protein 3 [Mizuhopecten yessoensis]